MILLYQVIDISITREVMIIPSRLDFKEFRSDKNYLPVYDAVPSYISLRCIRGTCCLHVQGREVIKLWLHGWVFWN
jgi:hypothetical protein